MGPSAREIHEITVTRAQALAVERLLGVPVDMGDRVRVEVVRQDVNARLPKQRSRSQAPDSADANPVWDDWLQGLDTDEPVHMDVPAAVVLDQVREHGEV